MAVPGIPELVQKTRSLLYSIIGFVNRESGSKELVVSKTGE
jgi:hypothetical protein